MPEGLVAPHAMSVPGITQCPIQETAISAQLVPGMRLRVYDFGVSYTLPVLEIAVCYTRQQYQGSPTAKPWTRNGQGVALHAIPALLWPFQLRTLQSTHRMIPD
eukprot:3224043-Rhodomonas_salina.3